MLSCKSVKQTHSIQRHVVTQHVSLQDLAVLLQITKHNYLVLEVSDLPRIMKEAFYLARTGRPGPVLVDVPKDIQQQLCVPDWDAPMQISGYMNRLPGAPMRETLATVVDAIRNSERPVAYVGGGCLDASAAVTELLDRTGIPTVQARSQVACGAA